MLLIASRCILGHPADGVPGPRELPAEGYDGSSPPQVIVKGRTQLGRQRLQQPGEGNLACPHSLPRSLVAEGGIACLDHDRMGPPTRLGLWASRPGTCEWRRRPPGAAARQY